MGILDTPSISRSGLPLNVKDFGAVLDGVTDDGPAINAALAAGQTQKKAVYIPEGTARVRASSMIDVKGTNVRLYGAGMGLSKITVFGETSVMNRVIGHTGNIDGLIISDLSFIGTTIDDVTGPRRSRTYTSNGFNSALQVSGDLAPSVTTVVKNVRIERVEVKGSAGLPMLFSGVRGEARLQNSRSELTMDWGWTWCERVVCIGNTSVNSADNGFSISRGNMSGVVQGNVVKNCAYSGIWGAGFKVSGAATDAGPTDLVITGNEVTTAGYNGYCLDDAPKRVTIVGNKARNILRGPSDQPTDIRGQGIVVGGFPSDNRTAPSIWAEDILIMGNELVDCARGGVEIANGVRRAKIFGNLVANCGSQFLADGVTAVLSTDLSNNFGISVMPGNTSTLFADIHIEGNSIIDDRATAYTNYAWYASGVPNARVVNNNERGTRQSAVLTHDNLTGVSHSGVHTYQSNTKFTAGATAGSNSGTGTIAGFDINGAAGSVRAHQFLTAGNKRWLVRASGDAETGANAGTRFQIDAYDDSGAFIKSMATFTRDGKLGFNGAAAVTPSTLPAAATDTATTQALANALRTALINLGLAN